ncbi:MAG: hypothetical protein Q8K93_06715 [Reyranella sp.]|uniref:hypothetical protein n=1 Tax=Reyranella sp. TaxID=1929291 RepID=UPI00272F8BA5|nr:hypothetical protein [Reyranella sp.]MDP1961875.1 hypothetical protein [Reyranella sp.]MDP2377396.1 hypothetical protein [Reyranella sp.]
MFTFVQSHEPQEFYAANLVSTEMNMSIRSKALVLGLCLFAIEARAQAGGTTTMPTYPVTKGVQLAPAAPPANNPGNNITIAPGMIGGQPGTNRTPPTQGVPGATVTIPIK